MLYQGSGESGIGVQTAIQQCQPRKWAAGCTRTSLGHSLATGGGTRRGSVRKATWRRGRNNFRVGIRPCEEDRSEVSETLQLQLPLNKEINKVELPAASISGFPGSPLASLSSLSSLSPRSPFLFLKHHRNKSADKPLYKFSQAFKNYHHFIMDNHS